MSDALPSPEEQEGLLRALGELIAKQGPEPFARAPLIEATPRFFPDPWTPDLRGVRVLALRVLTYAGLESLDVEVEPFEAEEEVSWSESSAGPRPGVSRRKHGAAAWFRGFDGDRCLFGVEVSLVSDAERLVGVLAHEVAHAYRMHHGLMVEDLEVEEELTDLTTLYLGFGILTVNGAYRYRATGHVAGHMAYTEWSFSQGGYLPLEAMSFLLAVQVVARGMEAGEVRRVEKLLERNQADSFRQALRALESRGAELAERLPVPSRFFESRQPPPEPRPLRHAIPRAEAPRVVPRTSGPGTEALPNQGRPVFRVRGSSPLAIYFYPFLGLIPMFILKGLTGSDASLLVPVAFGLWAWLSKRDYCSGTGCDATLKVAFVVCPSCGGTVAGSILKLRDKFDAEAEYWRKVRVRHGDGAVPEDALENDNDAGPGGDRASA